jgi:type II secretory ATPase GspE/PulE/Tfp pilus assembly ATPase PilB-like protein
VLRALLRQDPDVILLGEIRDFETAEVAFHAALTGHLVYSTLHTNSAVATIARLFDLGLKPTGGQRAGGHHRPAPGAPGVPPLPRGGGRRPALRRRLGGDYAGIQQTFRGRGCTDCHGTGYKGRVALYEVLAMDDELRDCIGSGASVLEIRRKVLRGIGQHGLEKVQAGITTLDEILRARPAGRESS